MGQGCSSGCATQGPEGTEDSEQVTEVVRVDGTIRGGVAAPPVAGQGGPGRRKSKENSITFPAAYLKQQEPTLSRGGLSCCEPVAGEYVVCYDDIPPQFRRDQLAQLSQSGVYPVPAVGRPEGSPKDPSSSSSSSSLSGTRLPKRVAVKSSKNSTTKFDLLPEVTAVPAAANSSMVYDHHQNPPCIEERSEDDESEEEMRHPFAGGPASLQDAGKTTGSSTATLSTTASASGDGDGDHDLEDREVSESVVHVSRAPHDREDLV